MIIRKSYRLGCMALAAILLTAALCHLQAEVDLAPFKGGYYHGVAYYPELWPEADVDRDIVKMKEAGINVVRMGEFAWSNMEPREGAISLDFFLRVMDKLHQAGIGVIFCTPTATPPIWLSYNHPERAFVDANGTVMSHGARQHMSDDNPDVISATQRIVEAIAKAVGKHPALVAWQIDNEFKCHVGEDFNESSIALWRLWLKDRYGTIEALNDAWGAQIWSEAYQNFDQVPAPKKTPFAHNASLATAYSLFTRDRIADYMDMQCAIIRKYSDRPITHNLSQGFGINLERMSRNLDFVSFDAYPSSTGWMQLLFNCDLFRSIKPDRPFGIMETSSSYNGWLNDVGAPHPPGFLSAEAALCYGLGSHTFDYWLWREQHAGVELEHSALLYAWGEPEIGFGEVQKVTSTVYRPLLSVLQASRPEIAPAAVTWSDWGRVFLQSESFGENANYHNIIADWHARLLKAGVYRDVRLENASLDGLKLLVTPAMPYVSREFLDRVKPWVEAGGIWIAGPLTGLRTREHTVPTDAGLGLLENFAGVQTVFSYPMKNTGAHGTALGVTAPLSGWCSAVRPATPDTTVLGTIATTYPSNNLAFLTERKMGKGKVILLTTQPTGTEGDALLAKLIDRCVTAADIPRLQVTEGSVICPRVTTEGRKLWLVVNLDGKGGKATLTTRAEDALTGSMLPPGPLDISPYGYRVVKF